jgi:hypothetical protein
MYTRAWTDTVLGTNPANTIDTLLANIRQDVNERLTDLFGISSFTADPLVATSIKLNRTANAKILGGTTNFSIRNSADTLDNLLIDDATGNLTIRGSISGALNASSLTTGTVPNSVFPATLPAISGANLTNLNASNLSSGTIPNTRLPLDVSFRGISIDVSGGGSLEFGVGGTGYIVSTGAIDSGGTGFKLLRVVNAVTF